MRRIVLARPIEGAPSPEDFRLEEAPLPEVGDGQFLARTIFSSVDPGTRSRLGGVGSYAAALKPGEVIDGFNVGQIVESRNEKFKTGEVLAFGGGWADHAISNGRGFLQRIPRSDVPLSIWIGILGVPGLTAWFGLRRVAQLKEGETVLVTSAAGPVGATAGQIAKLRGAARIIGVAGGPVKCAWLKDEAGFDEVIDYKASTDLAADLRAAAPEGVDVLFDNVGNAMIDRVIPLMKRGGRIVVSGQVADYNNPDPPGLKRTSFFITSRLRMEGLVVFDDMRQFPEAQAQMADWIAAGTLKYREERFEGIEALPAAFAGLFTGESFGRRIVRLGPDPN
ncbi:MAG: NADP-dependent oxidoreductase [Hyphomonadaceae bacterium]